MKAVVLAYHNMGCRGLEALIRHGFDIAAVFTYRDDPQEAGWFDSVAEVAARHDLPVFTPDDINHPLWIEKIKALKPDILFSFYYRDMVKDDLLAIPPDGCLNLHGSLLPAYRGRCPINWVLIHGEEKTGVTLHYMTPKPDDGDIVGQTEIPISETDTAFTLNEKSQTASVQLLDALLPQIKTRTAPRLPQDHTRASYFGGRKPKDGEIHWSKSSTEIRNLVRAVTRPYPGAFSFLGDRKVFFWEVADRPGIKHAALPGEVLSLAPLTLACGTGAVEVRFAQVENGSFVNSRQLTEDLNLVVKSHFGPHSSAAVESHRIKNVLILGVNGFIGSALSERLLASERYRVYGMDLHSDYIEHLLPRDNFFFHEGDIAIHREWIEYHVRRCDIVIPLVAIATPIEYVRNPIRVFELDFEENLRVVRYCVKYGKRIIFPSTSEVYGMCEDEEFDEDSSQLVLGPIANQRWIYSNIKQLLDRVIWAYGQSQGLKFTLFRPFNWVGPRLDRLSSARIGSSRAITQLILNLVEGQPMKMIDGGAQKRCFTDVEEAVECLYRIIENRDRICDGQIINIGNPANEASIRELAEALLKTFEAHPLRDKFPPFAGFQDVESRIYYGKGYEDVNLRKPSIRKAQKLLDWTPEKSLEQSVAETLDFFLQQAVDSPEFSCT